MSFLKKKVLSPDERYYRELERDNVPWRILKALAIVLFVGLILFAIHQRGGFSGSGPAGAGGANGQYMKPIDRLRQ